MEVIAVSAQGIESAPSNRVRYLIGHPQQTTQQPVYGWGPNYNTDIDLTFSSSVMDAAHSGGYATDWPSSGWNSTSWYSYGRLAPSNYEGLRVHPITATNRRIYMVQVYPTLASRFWLGLAQAGTWYGGFTQPQSGVWINSAAQSYFGVHPYLYVSPDNMGSLQEWLIGNQYNFTTDQCTIDVVVDELKQYTGPEGNYYRAAIEEIVLKVQDWVIVSYNTVVTVAEKFCDFW
jgi:hypothetical protein